MPNFSGIWNAAQQFQARGQNIWPKTPNAPTIGTATVASGTSVSVAFTAPACTGLFPSGISSYTAISTPGCNTASNATSPVVVTGLTTGTAYTFRVLATGANGAGPLSAASNSVTPAVIGQQAYTSAGTFSWVAPAGVTSVAVVVVGSGGGRNQGGGGGGLAYKNSISVTPGSSYSLTVSPIATGCAQGGSSSFTAGFGTLTATGGRTASQSPARTGGAPSGVYDGGGTGGTGGGNGGGGAAGYTGNGGDGSCCSSGSSGSGGGGGGGGGIRYSYEGSPGGGGGGGGVGILGQGASGSGGSKTSGGGGGSGGGSGGSGTIYCVGCSTYYLGGTGGTYGGGNGANCGPGSIRNPFGGGGAVRIIWPATSRSFPSTNTGNL